MKTQLKISAFVILHIVYLVCTIPLFSQNIEFKKTLPQGETNLSFITGIAQDGNGIMWFSTKMDLYKYDGYNFEAYKNNPLTTNSITGNNLETVFADSTGIIWIGYLGNGLDKFDPATGSFTHYQHNPDDKNSLANDTVTAILRDSDGNLWVGTHGGLDLFEPQTNTFVHFRHDSDIPKSLSSNQVRVIYEDSRNRLWIGTGSPYPGDGGGPESGGLNLMNKNDRIFTRFMHDPENPESLLSNKISAVFEDNQGIIWVGTGNIGLHKMNEKEGTFERLIFDQEHPFKLSAPRVAEGSPDYEHISFITQDIKNNFWFGTIQAGIYVYNPDSGKVVHYSGSDDSDSAFEDDGAWTAFSSKKGIFWFGGTNGGIYYTNPLHKNIPHINFDDKQAEAFYEDSNDIFWIISDLDVYRFTNKDKSPQKYVIESKATELNFNSTSGIYEDKKNNIWIGTPGGLSLWNNNNETFKHYIHNPNNNRSLSNNNVQVIYEDNNENLWIGTFNGLNSLDRETGLFTRYYPSGSENTNGNLITSIAEDHNGKLWIGTWNGAGVVAFDPEQGEFKTYLRGNYIACVYEDTNNILWAAGVEGLYRYNSKNDVFVNTRNMNQILDISGVYAMVEDDRKNLWLSTTKGIVKVNAQRDEINVYGEDYAVDGNSFIYISAYKGSDGKIYFGNSDGYYSFHPDDFTKNFNAPDIVFTGFHLANRLVNEGEEGLLEGRLSKVNEIRLSYNQNIFSFDFVAIDYANPEKNKTFYYLENYDNGWIQSNANQKAYYFGVPPGEYIFHVKAVNSYGIWAEKKITLTIMPPWWKKWWAYVLYGLIFTIGIFAFDHFMRRRIVQRERQKAQEKELKQAKEIEKAYKELKATQSQLIQSEKMASLGELTAGIAHEIQNPLNFVNNFSEVNTELADELEEEIKKGNIEEVISILKDIRDNESKINQHGKRAESIVKGMLLHSRGSSGKKEPTDINDLCDEYLRLAYHGFRAKDKSFNADFKLVVDESVPKIEMVPQDIGRVLLNLINNAFYVVNKKAKDSNGDYKPLVTVSTKKLDKQVNIKVTDNGPGIPSEIKDKIFQPFFTTKSTGEGTGLGLSLSYDIVKAHGGEISVESNNREGSVFTITI